MKQVPHCMVNTALILFQQPAPSPGWALAKPLWDSKGLRERNDEVVMRKQNEGQLWPKQPLPPTCFSRWGPCLFPLNLGSLQFTHIQQHASEGGTAWLWRLGQKNACSISLAPWGIHFQSIKLLRKEVYPEWPCCEEATSKHVGDCPGLSEARPIFEKLILEGIPTPGTSLPAF